MLGKCEVARAFWLCSSGVATVPRDRNRCLHASGGGAAREEATSWDGAREHAARRDGARGTCPVLPPPVKVSNRGPNVRMLKARSC